MKHLKILMILYYYLYVALIAELFPSEMSPMKWSDLEALGWKIRRYDARTQRHSYVTPVRSSKTRIINRKSDLDPCDAKYAEIIFPKISGKAGGNMRGSTEHVQVQEGVAILAEVEEADSGAQASDGPANHAPAGEKRAEFGDHRPAAAMLEEIRRGRDRLVALADGRFLPVFVPPWNRIGPGIAARLEEAGQGRVHGVVLHNRPPETSSLRGDERHSRFREKADQQTGAETKEIGRRR